jgi:N-acetylglucosamine-6-phosphate deacetylase
MEQRSAERQPKERTVTGLDPGTGRPIAVTLRQGRIASVAPGPAGESHWLAPGLVDLQVNGFHGHDLNAEDVSPHTVAELARAPRGPSSAEMCGPSRWA